MIKTEQEHTVQCIAMYPGTGAYGGKEGRPGAAADAWSARPQEVLQEE